MREPPRHAWGWNLTLVLRDGIALGEGRQGKLRSTDRPHCDASYSFAVFLFSLAAARGLEVFF